MPDIRSTCKHQQCAVHQQRTEAVISKNLPFAESTQSSKNLRVNLIKVMRALRENDKIIKDIYLIFNKKM